MCIDLSRLDEVTDIERSSTEIANPDDAVLPESADDLMFVDDDSMGI